MTRKKSGGKPGSKRRAWRNCTRSTENWATQEFIKRAKEDPELQRNAVESWEIPIETFRKA